MYCSSMCRDNMMLLKALFTGYMEYDYLRSKSHAQYMFAKPRSGEPLYKPILIGHIRLLGSERIWNTRFPDHCDGRDVFFAFLITDQYEPRELRGYQPGIAIVCRHYEYGLPYVEDIEDLNTILKIVGWEAFPYNRTQKMIDTADETTEKLLAFIIAENEKPYPPYNWPSIQKALKAYSENIRRQILGGNTQVIPDPKTWKQMFEVDRL